MSYLAFKGHKFDKMGYFRNNSEEDGPLLSTQV